MSCSPFSEPAEGRKRKITSLSGYDAQQPYRIIFFSRSRLDFDLRNPLGSLHALIAASLRRNTRHAISGLLLYDGEHFAEVLEGRRTGVEAAFSAVQADPRHDGVMIVERGDVPQRAFPNWSARYRDAADGTETELARSRGHADAAEGGRPGADLVSLLRYCLRCGP
jgi:Sensors of blue-light using FAD